MKFKNYIKVEYANGESKYITRIKNSTKQFFTDDGTEALAFGINNAKDMLYCLACNYYHAFIEVRPDFHIVCNPTKEGEEK